MAILTASDLKGVYLPSYTGTAEDTKLTAFIARAGAAIARFLGYAPASAGAAPTVESTTYTAFRRDLRGGDVIRFPFGPITAVSSIYDDPDRVFATALSASDYEIEPGGFGVRLLPLGGHPTWSGTPEAPARLACKITCTAGYATVDPQIVDACGWLVKDMWESRNTSTDEPAITTVTPRVAALLAPLRLPSAWTG